MTRALLLVDHGSRLPEAQAHLEAFAERVRGRLEGWRVAVAHLALAPPSPEEAAAELVAAGAAEIVLHPLFLAPGLHLSRDVPAAAQRVAERWPTVHVRVTPSLGEAPELADLVARLARE